MKCRGAAGRICACLHPVPPRLPLNYAPRSRARPIPTGWREWRVRPKDARALETANLCFCAVFADYRHGATRDKGHSAVI
jgi:hypothetical protein